MSDSGAILLKHCLYQESFIREVGIDLSPNNEIDKTLTFEAFVCKYRYENRQKKKTGYTSSKMLGLGKVLGTTKKKIEVKAKAQIKTSFLNKKIRNNLMEYCK